MAKQPKPKPRIVVIRPPKVRLPAASKKQKDDSQKDAPKVKISRKPTKDEAKIKTQLQVARKIGVVNGSAASRFAAIEALVHAGLTFEHCPDDYKSLREEAAFCSKLSSYAFMIMAQRLMKIRDERLYEIEGGYTDFVAFVENELAVTPRTAFNYMAILNHFGVKLLASRDDIEYSKLLPAVSVLKEVQDRSQKSRLRRRFLEQAGLKNKAQMIEMAKNVRAKLGLKSTPARGKPSFVDLAEKLLAAIPQKPSREEKNVAKIVINEISKIL